MAAKVFAVNDVLPATTQLRISWSGIIGMDNLPYPGQFFPCDLKSNNNSFVFFSISGDDYTLCGIDYYNYDSSYFYSPYTDTNGIHPYMDIDTSDWSLEKRTISSYENSVIINGLNITFNLSWEDLNAPSGYTISFNSNGGTTISDIEEATVLPTLPIPTKSGYTFVAWYYDDDFTTQAYAEDELEDDVTLYAKWQLITYTITYNSNGGSSIPQTSDATQLPNPLPSTTKPGYTFGGWYYESNFQTRAKAGDTIEANTTLYAKWLTLAQVLEHINNVVEELRSAIIDKGGDAEGKLLIDFATIINSLKTYEVVETLAELELLEPTLNRIVYVVEGSGELTMGEPVKITQYGDTLIIG